MYQVLRIWFRSRHTGKFDNAPTTEYQHNRAQNMTYGEKQGLIQQVEHINVGVVSPIQYLGHSLPEVPFFVESLYSGSMKMLLWRRFHARGRGEFDICSPTPPFGSQCEVAQCRRIFRPTIKIGNHSTHIKRGENCTTYLNVHDFVGLLNEARVLIVAIARARCKQ